MNTCSDCGEEFKDVKRHQKMSDCGDSGYDGAVMDTVCSTCETPLRRVERVVDETDRPHPYVRFEAVVKCDCSSMVIASTSKKEGRVPEGWL